MVDRGLSIYALADRLGLHPLEVAAIIGHERTLPKVLVFEEEDVPALESAGAVEHWWTNDAAPDARARFARILDRLLEARGVVRLDNVLRGLPDGDAKTLRSAIDELIDRDVIRRRDTLRGPMLSIGDPARAEAMRDGGELPEPIAKLLS
jgi:hypothetical protein